MQQPEQFSGVRQSCHRQNKALAATTTAVTTWAVAAHLRVQCDLWVFVFMSTFSRLPLVMQTVIFRSVAGFPNFLQAYFSFPGEVISWWVNGGGSKTGTKLRCNWFFFLKVCAAPEIFIHRLCTLECYMEKVNFLAKQWNILSGKFQFSKTKKHCSWLLCPFSTILVVLVRFCGVGTGCPTCLCGM